MAEEKPVVAVPPSNLGDLFAKKTKKKLASNLNNATSGKKEVKRVGKKDAEEDDWQEEEQVVASVLKVEAAGKLTRDEDRRDEEESSAPAWNTHKNKTDNANINEKKYPSLAKSVNSINIDDGSDRKINIQTSKNAFSAFADEQDSDEDGHKRPKEIKPALVQKKKGERVTDVIKAEVSKYSAKDKAKAAKKAKNEREDDSEDEESEEEEEEEDADEVTARKDAAAEVRRKEKADIKKKERQEEDKAKAAAQEDEDDEEEQEEDVKIVVDQEAAKAKYEGRRKLAKVDLPRSELEEEKVSRPGKASAKVDAGGKKKKAMLNEEDFEKKIPVWND